MQEIINKIDIRLIKGKGRGLFANENIKKGEIIFVEKCFQKVDENDSTDDLIKRIIKEISQCNISRFRLKHLFDGYNMNQDVDINIFNNNQKSIQLENITYDMVKNIVDFNYFQKDQNIVEVLRNKKNKNSGNINKNMIGIGLWFILSFINHSCVANISRQFIDDYVVAKAIKDILKDQEIVHDYYQLENERIENSFQGEIFEAENNWGFCCNCEKCLCQKLNLNLVMEIEQIYILLKQIKRNLNEQIDPDIILYKMALSNVFDDIMQIIKQNLHIIHFFSLIFTCFQELICLKMIIGCDPFHIQNCFDQLYKLNSINQDAEEYIYIYFLELNNAKKISQILENHVYQKLLNLLDIFFINGKHLLDE